MWKLRFMKSFTMSTTLRPIWCIRRPPGWSSMLGLLLLFLTSPITQSGATAPQGEALLQVATAWNATAREGPAYTKYFASWVEGTDPCGAVSPWVGVNCSGKEVFGLSLLKAGLRGPVPASISNLYFLQLLDLSNGYESDDVNYNIINNAITGDLEPIGYMTNLTSLSIGKTNLNLDSFPSALIKLVNLVSLKVANTFIRGPVPDLRNLTKLEVLWLGNNSFSGPFPTTITDMISLKELTIWGNAFNSTLPAELAKLVNLTYFNCNRCSLFGGLPPEWARLKKMKRMHLYKNALTGPIPKEWIQSWTGLQEMRIERNSLYGRLEPQFFKLANLTLMKLYMNQLTGPLPSVLNSSTTCIKEMALNCNYFTGNMPQSAQNDTNVGNGQKLGPFDYNCFNGSSDISGAETACARQIGCAAFDAELRRSGCPLCPELQIRSNASSSSCVCILDPCPKCQQGYARLFPGSLDNCECKDLTKSSKKVAAVIGATAAGGVLVFCLLAFAAVTRCFKHKPFDKSRDIFGKPIQANYDPNWKVPPGVQRFTMEQLAKATNNFDKSHEIGCGGFGIVFVGTVDGKTLAIKRAPSTKGFHAVNEFRNEVELLSRLHHRNLVKLEGFCDEDNMQILVYEFMRHGNLHMLLFRDDISVYMDWYKRLEIAVQIGQGLEYLHYHADPPVIHRDVKPGNILLDEYFNAKVADFGISKESAHFETHISTRPAGTIGYFDPQYFLNHQLTTASDVYSYGVCLLELVTGQKAVDHSSRGTEYNLIEWTKPRLNKEGVEAIVDPRLKGNYPGDIFLDMVHIAIACTFFDNSQRPTMKEVVAALEPKLNAAVRPPQWQLPLRAIPAFPNITPLSTTLAVSDNNNNSINSLQGTSDESLPKSSGAYLDLSVIIPR